MCYSFGNNSINDWARVIFPPDNMAYQYAEEFCKLFKNPILRRNKDLVQKYLLHHMNGTLSQLYSKPHQKAGHHVLPKTSDMPEIQKMAGSMSATPRRPKDDEELSLPSVMPGDSFSNMAEQGTVMTKSGKMHILQKPKPPTKSTVTPKVHRQLESPLKSSKSSRRSLVDNSTDRIRTREGNDFMTVEIDKRGSRLQPDPLCGSPDREPEQFSSGKVLSRRNSMKSSTSLDFDRMERDPEISSSHSQWTSQVKRSEYPVTQDTMTRTFSTLNQNSFRPAVAQSRYKKGLMEFDAPLPHSVRGNGPPSYVQRANTFIASHRPSTRKKYDKRTAHTGLTIPGSSSHQWQPDLPASHKDKNHNKFVPMQLRTQPNNLPGSVNRQKSMAVQDGTGLDAMGLNAFGVGSISRSKTDIGGYQQLSHNLQPEEVIPTVSHTSQKYIKDSRSSTMSSKGRMSNGHQVSGMHQSSSHHHQQEAASVMGGFAISNSALQPDSNKLQSAR